MPARKKNRRKTAFVPRVVFATAVVGVAVVPACVAACGGRVERTAGVAGVGFTGNEPPAQGGADGVAATAFGDVAVTSFGDAVATRSFGGGDVAAAAFGEVGFDGVAISAFGDVSVFNGDVAAEAFGVSDAFPAEAGDGSDDTSD